MNPQALKQIAMGLHQSGQPGPALSLYRQLLVQLPDDEQLFFMAGTAALQTGDASLAERLLDTSLALSPDRPVALANRATARMALQKYTEAETDFDHALTLAPDFTEGYFNRGNLHLALHKNIHAMADFDHTIALKPDHIGALYNRGTLKLAIRDHHGAIADFDRVIALVPRHAGAYNNRGNAWRRLRNPEEALKSYRMAAAIDPGGHEGHYNTAIALTELARPEEALTVCDTALKRHPNFAEAFCCRGNILRELGRFIEAVESYKKAEALKPDYAEARWDRSLVELLLGDYVNGWEGFEERWRCALPQEAQRGFTQPRWQGEDIHDKTILLHAEQGFGDTIQFCRYVPLVAERGARVLFEAPPALIPLLKTLKGNFTLLAQGGPLPAFDLHCPLMSLPSAFATRIDRIPSPQAYLSVDPTRTGPWVMRLGVQSAPRIGLVWSGRPGLVPDRTRSMSLARLSPLLAQPYEFHALQKEIRADDASLLGALPQLRTHCNALQDYADTAALIGALDLVISVDTSVAHLAGSIGKPVWLMLPFAPDWRWLTERSDSLWYESARLFRQKRRGDWEGLIGDIITALHQTFR